MFATMRLRALTSIITVAIALPAVLDGSASAPVVDELRTALARDAAQEWAGANAGRTVGTAVGSGGAPPSEHRECTALLDTLLLTLRPRLPGKQRTSPSELLRCCGSSPSLSRGREVIKAAVPEPMMMQTTSHPAAIQLSSTPAPKYSPWNRRNTAARAKNAE